MATFSLLDAGRAPRPSVPSASSTGLRTLSGSGQIVSPLAIGGTIALAKDASEPAYVLLARVYAV
jgi:hypothetical protein